MPRVVYIVGTLDYGGAEVLVRDLQITPYQPFTSEIIYHTDGDMSNELAQYSKKFGFNKLNLNVIKALRKYIKESKIDVVHVHSVVNPIKLLPVLIFSNVKTVFTVHGYSLNRRRIIKWITFQFFDSVLFVSETLKKAYWGNKKDCPAKFQVLYNGIDSDRFNKKPKRIKNELNLTGNTFLMGFIGNFNSVRDQLTVCKSLDLLKKRGHNFIFLFVGAVHVEEFYQECYSFCKERSLLDSVKFLGSRSDVPEILSSLDLFVYASNHDTFGIAVVEAMMSGTSVVVNDLDVFKEITDNGKNVKLYKSKDKNDLTSKIEELMDDGQRVRLAERAKKYARSRFSIEKHIQSLSSMYKKILKE